VARLRRGAARRGRRADAQRSRPCGHGVTLTINPSSFGASHEISLPRISR
jgi:hypothetical protein